MISRTQTFRRFFNTVFLRFILLSALIILFLPLQQIKADEKNGISIIIPNGSFQYTKVVNSIQANLKLNNFKEELTTVYLSNPNTTSINLNNKKLVILVGSSAFDFYTKSNAQSPYLTTLITKSAFDYIYSRANYKNNFIGGIMIDQPATRYVALAKALLPSLKKAGLVIGPEKIRQKSKVLNDVDTKSVTYNFVEISLQDNPVNKLRNAYESNQALIVFPDRKKFNRSLSRWILTLSYQYKKPLISYSKKYAEAGALASLFSTSERIGDQTAEMIIPFLKDSNYKNKKLIAPKYYDIYINQSVAKALNINVPAKYELLRKIPN